MLDKNGFKRKNYAELVAEMEQRAKELFGDDVNLSSLAPLGVIIRLFAWFLGKAYELAEKVYNSAFVGKAEGVQLDYLTPFYNTSRQMEQEATVTLSFTGTPNYTILEGARFETSAGVDYMLTEDVTLSANGTGTGLAVCLTAGSGGNVAAGSITVISEPSVDILTVTNLAAAEGGQDRETDTELTERLLNSGAGAGSGTTNAILAAVLAVQGVKAANIAVNNTMTAQNNQPAKSIQVYAHGGIGQSVAEAIFSKLPAGMEAYGTTAFTVRDIAGNNHTVKYTPASVVNIFANVNVVTDVTFEMAGATQVKEAILAVIEGLSQGDDVILQRLAASVMGVQGVQDVTVTIGKVSGSLFATNITIAANEVAQTDTDKISVVVT